jgi:hypothetical protein
MVRVMIAERVLKFLNDRRPDAVCDDCIAARLDLKRRQQAQRVTQPLSLTSDFDRRQSVCSLCGDEKLVIRAT